MRPPDKPIIPSRRPKSVHSKAYRKSCDILKKAREDAGLSQRQLAERLDEHSTFVWKIEAGERRLDIVEFVRWCIACEVEPDDLFQEIRKRVKTAKREKI